MKALVVSCSLHPESRSRILASVALDRLLEEGIEAELLDLATLPLPFCDGGACYGHPNAQAALRHIESAQAIILAIPIYNYDGNAVAKNLIELTGKGWENKIVGFLCAAGGQASYMSVLGLANSLMLDFRCLIIPRFVYATGESFTGSALTDEAVAKRVAALAQETTRFVKALASVPPDQA